MKASLFVAPLFSIRTAHTIRMNGAQRFLLGLACAATLVAPYLAQAVGPAPVNLGTADRFVLLAASGITSAGGLIAGDVGLSPTTGAAITGMTTSQVNGTVFSVDGAGPAGTVMAPGMLATAKVDLAAAYVDARDRLPVPTGAFLNPGGGDIGGMNLPPGLYKFPTNAAITVANVTLTGGPDDVWIFQIGTTLTVDASIHVVLAGGAKARNIFWQVGTTAGLGASSDFKGTIMADQSIVMGASANLEGRFMASVAAVTFSGTNGSLPEIAPAAPVVDITNQTTLVAYGVTSTTVSGTNNIHVTGTMTWTNALNGASGTHAATLNWLISGVPLAVGTNLVSVMGTNMLGATTNDSVIIVRGTLAAAVPVVDNANGATNIRSTSAVLNGTLVANGALPTEVYVFWGQTDGGTTFGNWDHADSLGIVGVGPLTLPVAALVPDRTYVYRFYAVNSAGAIWATASSNFLTLSWDGPLPPSLGTAARFMILAASGITSAGGLIAGDVGLSPTTGAAITGMTTSQVNGTVFSVDGAGPVGAVMAPAMLTTAKADLAAAYADARDRLPVPTGAFLNPGVGDIGGMNLPPGLYKFPTTAGITVTNVTLTGGPNDVWIFQIGTTLIVDPSLQIVLAGGAKARNIFWQVGSSATLGASTVFKGTLMADQSITMGASATIEGRLMASVAAITFSGASGSLPTPPPAPTFTGIFVATNEVTLVLATAPNLLLSLEACTDLVSTNWSLLDSATPVKTTHSFNLPVSAFPTKRFYRAVFTP